MIRLKSIDYFSEKVYNKHQNVKTLRMIRNGLCDSVFVYLSVLLFCGLAAGSGIPVDQGEKTDQSGVPDGVLSADIRFRRGGDPSDLFDRSLFYR